MLKIQFTINTDDEHDIWWSQNKNKIKNDS